MILGNKFLSCFTHVKSMRELREFPLPSREGTGVGECGLERCFRIWNLIPNRSPPSLNLPARGRENLS